MISAAGQSDVYDLQRFVAAQNPVYDAVCAELRAGEKRGHWMWFIFPQIKGLGQSSMAQHFGITSLTETAAYLQHPLLGSRLRECCGLVNAIVGRSATDIFGHIDSIKFRSSMTLFANASTDDRIFNDALKKYFAGEPDPLTLERLNL